MNASTRAALEAKGYVFEDAEDFLDLTPEERRLVDLRLALSRAIRKQREAKSLTQEAVAKLLGVSQPRYAIIESASQGVSLDAMVKAYFRLGGKLEVLPPGARRVASGHLERKSPKRSTAQAPRRRAAAKKEPVGSGCA